MESSSSAPRKEKKGLGRLWTKVKLAIRSKSKSNPKAISPTTTTTKTTASAAAAAAAAAEMSEQQQQPSQTSQTAQRYCHQKTDMSTQTNEDSVPPSQPESTSSQPPIVASATASTPMGLPQDKTSTSSVYPGQTEAISVVEPHTEPQEQPGPASAPEKNTAISPRSDAPPDEKQELARRYGRAQAIFKKYNMELDEASWDSQPQPQPQIERIYKAPRIRVRWTCHECKTTFGHDKICAECAHHRCKNCPRYPPKKKKAKAAKMAAFANTMSEQARDEDTEMQDGVCHECQTSFEMGSEECSNCHHRICDRCLQETLTAAEHNEPQAVES